MSRRRTFLFVFAVLVIILIGGVTALVLMSRRATPPGQEPETQAEVVPTPTLEPAMETVVVIVQPIRRGERIPPDAVELRKWEADLLPDDPVRSLDKRTEQAGDKPFTRNKGSVAWDLPWIAYTPKCQVDLEFSGGEEGRDSDPRSLSSDRWQGHWLNAAAGESTSDKMSGMRRLILELVFPQLAIKTALADSKSGGNPPSMAGEAPEEVSDVLNFEFPQCWETVIGLG